MPPRGGTATKPITEGTRRQRHDTVAQQLGPEAAAQPMEVTIPADTELATRADLDSLRSELYRSFLPLDGPVVAVMSYLTR